LDLACHGSEAHLHAPRDFLIRVTLHAKSSNLPEGLIAQQAEQSRAFVRHKSSKRGRRLGIDDGCAGLRIHIRVGTRLRATVLSTTAFLAAFVLYLVERFSLCDYDEQPPQVIAVIQPWKSTSRQATAKAIERVQNRVFFIGIGAGHSAQPRRG